ncbi:MAG: hypothetical protein N2595_10975 [bacterium]|nr:hypothetical protein [bacterium]
MPTTTFHSLFPSRLVSLAAVALLTLPFPIRPTLAGWEWTTSLSLNDDCAAWAAASDSSGNIFIAGESTLTGNVDMLLAKYSPSGSLLWSLTRGSAGPDSATAVACDLAGNVLIAGPCATAFDSQPAFGSGDYALIKFNPAGSWQWTRTYGSTAYDAAFALTVSSDGVIYVTGTTEHRFGSSTHAGQSDIFLTAHNPDGSLRWALSRGSSSDEWASAILLHGSYLFLAGVTAGALDGNPSRGDLDGFIMCFDTNGNWQWTRQFGTNDQDIVTALSRASDGTLYATGRSFGELSSPGRDQDILIARLSSAGALEYLRALGTLKNDSAVAIQVDASYLNILASTDSAFPGQANNGATDLVMLQCTTNADFQSANQTGTPNDDIPVGGSIRGITAALGGFTPASFPGAFDALAGAFSIPEPALPLFALFTLTFFFRRAHTRLLILLACLISLPSLVLANPVEELSSLRGRLILNGLWSFKPALNASGQMTNGSWGSIWVPGSWRARNNFAGVQSVGSGPAWDAFGGVNDGRRITACWYRTTVKLPPHWQGRGWSLELRRVSTDARVVVNGIDCGQINWPFGTLEITHALRRQPLADIRIFVLAHDVVTNDNQLGFGLIGEVFLHSHPRNARVNDVFVKPSVRNWQLGLDIELVNLKSTGNVTVTPRVYNESGSLEKTFDTLTLAVTGTPTVLLTANWPWSNPRLWDLDQPNLYTLKLTVNGCGINDEFPVRFGFREFWIEGRYFKLNGSSFRCRPALPPGESYAYGNVFGVLEQIDGQIRSMRAAGFNCCEFWPDNEDVRGRIFFRDLWYERADQIGFPVFASIVPANTYFPTWSSSKETYRQRLALHIKRIRNNPSIIMWVTSPNAGFNTEQDQNPRYLGRFADLFAGYPIQYNGLEQIAMIKSYDPTRPATTHHGGCVGDVHAANHYLNLHPLQDRTEWLSCWATNADMPFCSIEFGTPFFCTFFRGRNGFNGARYSEPLVTEFSAIYLGRSAFSLEQSTYRSDIKTKFQSGQSYSDWNGDPDVDGAPPFQAIQALFNTHTFRSWRAFNLSGGMIPWNDAYGWSRTDISTTNLTFYPGRRGAFLSSIFQRTIFPYQLPYSQIRPSGYALITNNSDTLAWIAGPSNSFTDLDHSFLTNSLVHKSIVIQNDSRSNLTYSFTWTVTNNGTFVTSGSGTGAAAPGTTTFIPLSFSTPASIPSTKTHAAIYLNATIGTTQHKDTFPFRVFSAW